LALGQSLEALGKARLSLQGLDDDAVLVLLPVPTSVALSADFKLAELHQRQDLAAQRPNIHAALDRQARLPRDAAGAVPAIVRMVGDHQQQVLRVAPGV
jgi:hypothetical protein